MGIFLQLLRRCLSTEGKRSALSARLDSFEKPAIIKSLAGVVITRTKFGRTRRNRRSFRVRKIEIRDGKLRPRIKDITVARLLARKEEESEFRELIGLLDVRSARRRRVKTRNTCRRKTNSRFDFASKLKNREKNDKEISTEYE